MRKNVIPDTRVSAEPSVSTLNRSSDIDTRISSCDDRSSQWRHHVAADHSKHNERKYKRSCNIFYSARAIGSWSRMGLLHHGALHLSAVNRLLSTFDERRKQCWSVVGKRQLCTPTSTTCLSHIKQQTQPVDSSPFILTLVSAVLSYWPFCFQTPTLAQGVISEKRDHSHLRTQPLQQTANP